MANGPILCNHCLVIVEQKPLLYEDRQQYNAENINMSYVYLHCYISAKLIELHFQAKYETMIESYKKKLGKQWFGRDFCQWAIFSFFQWLWNFQWALSYHSTQTLMGHFQS